MVLNPRASLLALTLLLSACPVSAVSLDVQASGLADPGPYSVGKRQVTVTRPSGQTFTSLFYYPATQPGNNTPVDPSGSPYPAITFGHGFLQPPSNYESTLMHLASWGYFVMASESYTGFFPNHALFAADLSHCLTWLEEQNNLAGGELEGLLDVANYGASGHSMGGGCSILAIANDSRIRVLANLAAAETSTSAIAAMEQITVPVRLIAGTDDSITPVEQHGALMYDNGNAPKQLPLQQGGFHCGYLDFNVFGCDSGSMSRAVQLALTRRDLTAFFNLYLKGDQSVWREVWGPEAFTDPHVDRSAVDSGITLELDASEIKIPVDESASASLTITNTGVAPTAYAIFIDDSDWIITPEPTVTDIVAMGEQAVIMLTINAPADAKGEQTQPVISARAEVDGGTRNWTILTATAVDGAAPADLNNDGVVDGADLLILLSAWGDCANPDDCPADLDGNGIVDGADLLILLSNWG
jgi:dienelactone hydrolase